MFSKYDTNGDRLLDEEEQMKMQHELEGQKVAWCGLVSLGVAWCGLVWLSVACCGLV